MAHADKEAPPKNWNPSEPEWMRSERKLNTFFAVALAVIATIVTMLMVKLGLDDRILMGFVIFTFVASAFVFLRKNFLPYLFVSIPAAIVVMVVMA